MLFEVINSWAVYMVTTSKEKVWARVLAWGLRKPQSMLEERGRELSWNSSQEEAIKDQVFSSDFSWSTAIGVSGCVVIKTERYYRLNLACHC